MTSASSDFSTSSINSPGAKRIREDIEGTVGEPDEVFEALTMADSFGKKLEAVLTKLQKLDVIEHRLNALCTTLSNIEENINRIDNDVKTLKSKSTELDKSFKTLEESVNFNEDDISDLKQRTKANEHDVMELQKQLLYMETYSRRENVKFLGIKEEEDANQASVSQQAAENTREIVYKFMEEQLKIDQPRKKIEFQRLHRLGKPNAGKSRPIIARFLRYSDKELVMDQARKNLQGTDFAVFDDIPKTLYDSRKTQLKKLKEAREKGYTAFFSKAHPDKLFVNGQYLAPDRPVS